MWLGMLGPLTVRPAETEVAVPAAKQRVVLAALLVRANQVVSFDELAEIVWDGAPPPTARVTLRNYVKCLRRLLGPAAAALIVTRDPGYQLRAGQDELDLLRFEHLSRHGAAAVRAADWPMAARVLAEALGLWRGEPLADIASDVLRAEAAPRLERWRLQALEGRVDADLNLGRHADLVLELQCLTGEQPLRERFHGQLMLALYRSGRAAEALTAYDRVRGLLAAHLGTEPGPELRDLHLRILREDQGLVPGRGLMPGGGRPVVTAGRPSPMMPRQLPATARHFAGRTRELAALTGLLDRADDAEAAVAICAIDGTAGVGKTTLAIRFAHQVADRFPDGQLYVNLRGFDPSGPPVRPAQAIRGFLDALGVEPKRIPADLAAQAALYRSLLAGRRVLIVLDNAKDSAQVRPLLPGDGCLVVVTSRSQLIGTVAAEGAHPLTLDLLSGEEACELLARRLGAGRIAGEPAAAADLVRLCARLPLALSVAAARIASRPGLSLAAVAGELRMARNRLDALSAADPVTDARTVFSWSYTQLKPAAARMFRLLGVHPGPDISAAAAASLAGIPPDEARRALHELTRAHLITEAGPGRFALHDLMRAFGAEQAAERDRAAGQTLAAHRVLDHYLQTAFAADRLLSSRDPIDPVPIIGGVGPERLAGAAGARAWFRAEHQVLLGAVRLAADLGFDAHAWQIPWSLVTFLDRQGHWPDWECTQQIALAAARRLGDAAGQAQALRQLGRLRIQRGPYAEAEAPLTEALGWFRRAGDPVGQARVRLDMAHTLERQRRYRDAIKHSREALNLFRVTGHRVGESRALNGIGWCYACLGDAEQALPYCEQALALDRAQGNLQAVSATEHSLGYVHHLLGNHVQAVVCYEESLGLSRQLGDRYGQADALGSLGDTYRAAGHLDEAHLCWQHALEILDDLGHPEASMVRGKLRDLGTAAKDAGPEDAGAADGIIAGQIAPGRLAAAG